MKEFSFRTVLFGGFRKDDVIHYISELTKLHSRKESYFKTELANARLKTTELEKEKQALETKMEQYEQERLSLFSDLEERDQQIACLNGMIQDLKEDYAKMEAENDRLEAEYQARLQESQAEPAAIQEEEPIPVITPAGRASSKSDVRVILRRKQKKAKKESAFDVVSPGGTESSLYSMR